MGDNTAFKTNYQLKQALYEKLPYGECRRLFVSMGRRQLQTKDIFPKGTVQSFMDGKNSTQQTNMLMKVKNTSED